MSNIYIQEPPTNGKVLIKTSAGDIDVELWSKEAPKACRNFVQLCMEGYYDGTIFHRVVPDFIIQGGDPTGTGSGGESIYGRPFKDEFHSRLRFNRRGLVAMANAGRHDNGSQFFFTLGRADELNNKHTIFGKVAGDTIYNILRLAEVECDADERPLNPHKIRATEVLHSPFDDIVPREIKQNRKDHKEEGKKSQSKATKNFSLLSFGEEAEEDEELVNQVSQTMKGKSKSSHDLLKDDPLLSTVPVVDRKKGKDGDGDDSEDSDLEEHGGGHGDDADVEGMRERIANKLKKEKKEDLPHGTEREESEKKTSRSCGSGRTKLGHLGHCCPRPISGRWSSLIRRIQELLLRACPVLWCRCQGVAEGVVTPPAKQNLVWKPVGAVLVRDKGGIVAAQDSVFPPVPSA
ncbi:hypothetical protein ACEWY4_016450 [Coilia grayii]|uniref:Spliceosome-associated protein CWC27 homolog n=1 Tax=Coilia grayii TaxID=363190 RepID=A0ABD1JKH9_9TELE